MPRITVDIDEDCLGALRRRSRAERRSVDRVASELLAQALGAPAGETTRPFAWSVASLGVPLVDLEDKRAVRRALEDPFA